MSDQPTNRPHLLHGTLASEGYWDGLRLDCPYDADDPSKPCAMVDIDTDRAPIPGCAGQDWLDGLGIEILGGRHEDPQFPLEVDVTWHSGGDHLTLEPHAEDVVDITERLDGHVPA